MKKKRGAHVFCPSRQIGTSDVWVLPHPNPNMGRIRIPIPPSVNARQRPAIRYRRTAYGTRAGMELVLTPQVVGYYLNALPLRMAWKSIMSRPLEDYAEFEFQFYLGNDLYDTHNGLKVSCDMIEKSGLISNDRFILPQVARPVSAPTDPRLIISFPLTGNHPRPSEGATA